MQIYWKKEKGKRKRSGDAFLGIRMWGEAGEERVVLHPGHHVNICAAGGAKLSALTGKEVGVFIRVNTHMSGDPLNDYCNVRRDKRNGALHCLDKLRVGFAFPTAGQAADTVLGSGVR